jgi:hypothetical protein
MHTLSDRITWGRFLTSFAAGLTAIGIVNFIRWLRAPVTGR